MPEKTRGAKSDCVIGIIPSWYSLKTGLTHARGKPQPQLVRKTAMENENPVNPIPPVIIAIALVTAAIEIAFTAAGAGLVGGVRGIGWRVAAIEDYAFSPVIWELVVERGQYSGELLKRFVSYPFVHASFTSALFVVALTLALGKFVGDIFKGVPTLMVYLLSTLVGAAAFGIIVDGAQPLIGGFTPVYGLIGAYTYVVWLRLGASGQNQMKAFRLIGFLLGIQLAFGLIFGSNQMWIAELAGFITGFLSSTILAPGGWSALLARMRNRS